MHKLINQSKIDRNRSHRCYQSQKRGSETKKATSRPQKATSEPKNQPPDREKWPKYRFGPKKTPRGPPGDPFLGPGGLFLSPGGHFWTPKTSKKWESSSGDHFFDEKRVFRTIFWSQNRFLGVRGGDPKRGVIPWEFLHPKKGADLGPRPLLWQKKTPQKETPQTPYFPGNPKNIAGFRATSWCVTSLTQRDGQNVCRSFSDCRDRKSDMLVRPIRTPIFVVRGGPKNNKCRKTPVIACFLAYFRPKTSQNGLKSGGIGLKSGGIGLKSSQNGLKSGGIGLKSSQNGLKSSQMGVFQGFLHRKTLFLGGLSLFS